MSNQRERVMQSVTSKVEIRNIAPGLWIWRAEHHHWKPGDDWQPVVTSTFVESGAERLVIEDMECRLAAICSVQIFHPTADPLVWRELQEMPVQTPFMNPLPPLAKLSPHEQQLFPR